MQNISKFALAGIVAGGIAAPSFADSLTEEQSAEVRAIVQEVLADADARASLLQEGATAGISDSGKIFLRSANGQFSAHVGGQIQFRYIANYEADRDYDTGEIEDGFQRRRTKVNFSGHVGDPRFTYTIVLAGERDDNGDDVGVEDAIIGYEIQDGLTVRVGTMKLPFAREELISSTSQVAVDRGQTTEHFTLNRADQVQLSYEADMFRLAGALSDGANEATTDFNNDNSNLALTGRAEVLIDGEWGQAKTNFGDDEQFLMLGGAAHYEDVSNYGAVWLVTADATYKNGNFGVFGAIFFAEDENDGNGDFSATGVNVQANYNVSDDINVFAGFDYINADETEDEMTSVNVGVNYFFNNHVKLTGDIVYVFGNADQDIDGNVHNAGEFSDGLGLLGPNDEDENQIALRVQLQLIF